MTLGEAMAKYQRNANVQIIYSANPDADLPEKTVYGTVVGYSEDSLLVDRVGLGNGWVPFNHGRVLISVLR